MDDPKDTNDSSEPSLSDKMGDYHLEWGGTKGGNGWELFLYSAIVALVVIVMMIHVWHHH